MPGRLAAARASREASERSAQLLPRRTASTQGGLPAELEDASLDGESNAISCASGSRLLHNTYPEASVGLGSSVRNQQQQQLHDVPTSSQSVTFLVSSEQHGQNGTPTAAAAISHHAGGSVGSEPSSPALPLRVPSAAIPPLPSAGTLVVQTSGGSGHISAASVAAAATAADPARGQWQGTSSSSFHHRSSLEWTAADEPESSRAGPAIGSGAIAAAPAFAFAAAVNANTSIPSAASAAGTSAGTSATAASATGGIPPPFIYQSSLQQPVGAASEQVWRAAVVPVERSRPSLVTAIPVRHSRLRIAATASEVSGASFNGTVDEGAGATSVAAGMGSATTGGSSSHHCGSQQQSAMRMQLGEARSAAGATASEGMAPPILELPASLGNPPSEAMVAWTASATRAFSGGGSSSTGGTPAGTVGGTGSFVSRGRGPRHRLTPAGSVGFGGVSELFADGGRGEEPPSGESSFTVRQTPSDMEDELIERARARRAIRSLTLANMALEPRSPDGSASVAVSTVVRRPETAIAGDAAAAVSALTAGTYGHIARVGTTYAVPGAATMPADASGAPNGASRVAIRLHHQPGHQRRPPNRHASMPAMKRDGANSAGGPADGADGGRCGGGGTRKSPLTRPPLSGGLLPEDAVPEDIEGEDVTSLQYSALAGVGGGPGGGGDLPSGYSRMPSDSPVTSQMSLTSSVACQGPGSTAQQRQLSVPSLQQAVSGGGSGAAVGASQTAGAAAISSGGGGTGSGSTGANAIVASLALAPAQPPQLLSRLAAPGFPPAGVPPALLVRLPDVAGGSSGQRPSFEEDITRPTPAFLVGSSTIPGAATPPAPNSQLSGAGFVGAAADRPSQRGSRMLSGAHAQTHSSSLAALHKAVEKLMLQVWSIVS
ncbi:hypothetical protein Vretifemale_1025 [Volvox reticuliferus]|uniref:Uncharacterized protein n=1 Tax=Volvox reticuliferus TaxID=1737510 RepID=A0A8J4C2K4_9CHLO|nr:hypothetical protein Vretifemale_1025 [Volvox reticuliferus]